MKILHSVKGIWITRAELDYPLITIKEDSIVLAVRGGKYQDIPYRVILNKDELRKINVQLAQHAMERN
jgi:hypothetical protein